MNTTITADTGSLSARAANARGRKYGRILVLGLLLLALGVSGCATTPYTNRSQLMLLNSEEEMALGVAAQTEIAKTEKFETGTARSKRVERIGKRLAAVADRDDFTWEFYTIAKNELNAFCLPGGKIYFYTGMLDFLGKDDAQVAAVMGHEIAHAISRHSAERKSQNVLVALGVATASAAASVASDNGAAASSVGSAAAVLAQFGILLPFSRLHESESDHIGTILMAKAGYDPRKAVTVWEKMEKEQGGSSRLAGFFSTHPVHADRIADLQKMMPEALKYYEQSSKKP